MNVLRPNTVQTPGIPRLTLCQGKVSNRYLATGKVSVTFTHDLFLGVGLLIQDAQLIIAIYEHDAGVISVFNSALILLHIINIVSTTMME